MDLLAFIRTADPTKVRVAERQRAEDEPRLLESTVRSVVSLLPIAPTRASSELEASDVAPLQPRRHRKRKTDVADADGPSHPPKKLREDYGALGGAFTADKSPADSVPGLNHRTIGAPQRFVISSDSSHHFDVDIAEAEADSIVRSSAPAIATVTTMTATIDADATTTIALVAPSLFGVVLSSTGRTDSVLGGFSDVSSSDFLIGGIRTVVDPDFDLQKVYLFTEFNVGAARQISLNAEAELLKIKDGEIESLKAQLLLKEAEATEAIRLRTEVFKFESVDQSLRSEEQEVTDLDAQVTAVKLQNDNLVHELEISSAGLQEKVVAYEGFVSQLEKFQDEKLEEVNEKFNKLCVDFVDMALHLEEKFYPHLLNTISGRRWLLTYGMELAVVKCLNLTEYLSALGAAISKAVEKDDIQCAGSDTRPPMLDRIDFASWQQRIRLYCRGKENGVNILNINEGPFQLGTFRETLVEGDEGETIHDFYIQFAKLINDMRNIKMTMSKMQLNSNFVNNMLPEWGRFVMAVKLNRGLRNSNYDQLYAYVKQHEAHANENKMMLDRFTQHIVDPLALMVDEVEDRGTMQEERVQLVMGELKTELGTLIQAKQGRLSATTAMENWVALDEEQLLFIIGRQDNVDDDMDEQPIQDLALNVDNVFQADECDAFDSDVDKAPTAQTMFMANLSFVDPVYDLDILSEVHDHDNYQDAVCKLHEKENKPLEEFFDMRALKEKVKDRLFKQDQSLQIVHMFCKPKPHYDEQRKIAIGYKNPLYLSKAKQVQPALYSGQEIVKSNHARVLVHDLEDTLNTVETTRKQMNEKIKDPECVKNKVKITPHDYSKENYLV
nr:transposase (putative), gypsy type [Tanacetum cinerariifolium]